MAYTLPAARDKAIVTLSELHRSASLREENASNTTAGSCGRKRVQVKASYTGAEMNRTTVSACVVIGNARRFEEHEGTDRIASIYIAADSRARDVHMSGEGRQSKSAQMSSTTAMRCVNDTVLS